MVWTFGWTLSNMVYEATLLCNLPTGTMPNGAVFNENSGFADSRRHANVFWAHEDSEKTATPNRWVYAFNYTGTIRKVIELTGNGIQVGQWEDMAYHDATNSMWIANCGNNGHTSDTFRAYKFTEPATLGDANTILQVPCTTYQFRWPDSGPGGWNCETMLCDPNGRIYFVNKEPAADTALYAAPTNLVPWTSAGNETNVLQRLANWTAQSNLTCGDWAPDNHAIYVGAGGNTRGFKYSTTSPYSLIEEFVLASPKKTNGTSQRESLCVSRDNTFLLTGTEGAGSEVLKISLGAAAPSYPTYIWRQTSSQTLAIKYF